MTEAEIGVMWFQEPTDAETGRGKDWILHWRLQKTPGLQPRDTNLEDPASGPNTSSTYIVSSHQVPGHLL